MFIPYLLISLHMCVIFAFPMSLPHLHMYLLSLCHFLSSFSICLQLSSSHPPHLGLPLFLPSLYLFCFLFISHHLSPLLFFFIHPPSSKLFLSLLGVNQTHIGLDFNFIPCPLLSLIICLFLLLLLSFSLHPHPSELSPVAS